MLADYVFKVKPSRRSARGDALLQFFALYYAGVSLLAFVVQSFSAPIVLEKLGLAVTTATPSLALLVGGLGGLVFPGLGGALVARAAESTLRSSLFKTGYEIFFTPIAPHDKRAAKSIIDVGFDRLGDAVGGGLIRLLIMLPATVALLGVARRGCWLLGYRRRRRAAAQPRLHPHARAQPPRSRRRTRAVGRRRHHDEDRHDAHHTCAAAHRRLDRTARDDDGTGADAGQPIRRSREILALRSRNRDAVLQVLRSEEGLPAPLIPHVIPLLAWDPVAEDAVRALRKVAEERVGELIDALLDPNQPFASRRRLARVFSVCVSQRAVDGVLLGLEDLRFEVRFQCGRSLAAILEKNPRIRIDKERVFDVVRREVAVGRPVWESHRLLDTVEADSRSFVDEFLKDRAGQSLAHVFTLLSLVLPTAPLQIAYRGLHTDDPGLRGTALEYLEGVLPPDIRDRLWPFLSDRPQEPARRPRP